MHCLVGLVRLAQASPHDEHRALVLGALGVVRPLLPPSYLRPLRPLLPLHPLLLPLPLQSLRPLRPLRLLRSSKTGLIVSLHG